MRRAMVLAAMLAVGCAEPALLDLSIVLPDGPDPFAGADEVKLLVSNPAGEATTLLSNPTSLDISLEVDVAGQIGQVALEAYSGASLIARGETPFWPLRAVDDAFGLLVAKAGALSRLKSQLADPRSEMLVAPMPGVGFLVAGGHDADGVASRGAQVYDYWNQQFAAIELQLPEERAEGIAVSCGSTCALIALGRNNEGLASTILGYRGGWTQMPDGLDAPLRRRRASVAPLDDGSFLVVGGLNEAGDPISSLLRFDPGLGADPLFTPLGTPARAARDLPAVASTGVAVVVVGGQADGEPVAELIYPLTEQSVELTFEGGSPVSGAAAVLLDNGKVAVLGGVDQSGALLADGWIVDPAAQSVIRVAGALSTPRAGHVAMVAGGQVIVVGGDQGDGGHAVELLSEGLTSLRVVEAPGVRHGARAAAVGSGSFLLFGGLDAQDQPVAPLAIFETGQSGLSP